MELELVPILRSDENQDMESLAISDAICFLPNVYRDSKCPFSRQEHSWLDSKERSKSTTRLSGLIIFYLMVMVVEIIGGIKADSLAVLTDAAHLLTDVAGFAIALFTVWVAGWEATPHQSFGFNRLEVLGAMLSVQLIWLVSGILIYEAIDRILHKHGEVNGEIMFGIAAFGFIINLIMVIWLGHDHSHHGWGNNDHCHGHHDHHDHDGHHDHHDHDGHHDHHDHDGHHDHHDHDGHHDHHDHDGHHDHHDHDGHHDHHDHQVHHGHNWNRDHHHGHDGNRDHHHGHDGNRDHHHGHDGNRDNHHSHDGNRDNHHSHDRNHDHHHGHDHDHHLSHDGNHDHHLDHDGNHDNHHLGHDGNHDNHHLDHDGNHDNHHLVHDRNHDHHLGHDGNHDSHHGHDWNHDSPHGHDRNHDQHQVHHGHDQHHDHGHDHARKESSSATEEEDATLVSSSPSTTKTMNINIQGAYLHVMADLIQSIGVMIGGAIIWAKPDWLIVDLLCTLIFSTFALTATLPMLRNIFYILMERAPSEISIPKLENDLKSIDGVQDIHDLHVWSITVGKIAMSCHVTSEPGVSSKEILEKIRYLCDNTYRIHHVTIQIEE